MKLNILFFAFIIISFSACTQVKNETIKPKEKVSQSETTQICKRVNKAKFNAFLNETKNAVLLDVRTPQEYNSGTIGEAININFYDKAFKSKLEAMDKSVPVLLFCRSGGRSGKALSIMKSLGFEHVLELAGGYSQYK